MAWMHIAQQFAKVMFAAVGAGFGSAACVFAAIFTAYLVWAVTCMPRSGGRH